MTFDHSIQQNSIAFLVWRHGDSVLTLVQMQSDRIVSLIFEASVMSIPASQTHRADVDSHGESQVTQRLAANQYSVMNP